MTTAPRDRRPLVAVAGRRGIALLLAVSAAAFLGACESAPSTPSASATPASVTGAPPTKAPVAVASPVTGRLVKLDSEGLTRVRGFTLRLDDGSEIPFVIGALENGGQFPPGHLAEHMASSSAVKVFFRDEDGAHVVYRLEDGE